MQKIKLTNMKSTRVGRGIAKYRVRNQLTQKQLAEKLQIDESFLVRIEEGYEPEIDYGIFRNLAGILVGTRGKPSPEDLINIFLNVPEETPSLLI